MPLPSRAAILGFIAKAEPLQQTLEQFPGVTREHLKALLREAALLMHAEEEGAQTAGPDPAPRAPLVPAPEKQPDLAAPTVEQAAQQPPAALKMLRLFSDGAARGNPGPAGAGAVLTRADGTVIAKAGKFLGPQTNNYAEYAALIIGLETALRLGAEEIEIVADSELMVRQVEGTYRVKNAGLKPLHERVTALLKRFARSSVRHVPRAQNKLADEMSNRAIDEKL
jgi:ribonuclease HI